MIAGTSLFNHLSEKFQAVESLDPMLFIMKCHSMKIEKPLEEPWIQGLVEHVRQNAFRLYGSGVILEDLINLGQVLTLLQPPKHRRQGRNHLEKKTTSSLMTFSYNLNDGNFDDIGEIVIDNLNKIPMENIYSVLSILKYLCHWESFQHRIKLNHLHEKSLQELYLIDFFQVQEVDYFCAQN
jgi:hypothetical protein